MLKLYQTQSRPDPRRTAGGLVGNIQAATFFSPHSKARAKTRCATSNLPYPGAQHCAAQVIKQPHFLDTQRKRPPPAHLFSQSRDKVAKVASSSGRRGIQWLWDCAVMEEPRSRTYEERRGGVGVNVFVSPSRDYAYSIYLSFQVVKKNG
jgi:hypothetical protein